jgi:FAD:protein FMN transferase
MPPLVAVGQEPFEARIDRRTRLMRKRWSVFAAVVVFSAQTQADDGLIPYKDDWVVMATALDITLYRPATEAVRAQADLDAAAAEVSRLDNALSLYRANSELVALNSADVGHAVKISDTMTDVLSAAAKFGALSDGAFDISIQPLVNVWGFYHVNGARVPTADQIQQARERVGPQRWQVKPETRTATLMPGTRLDLGGIAKGYGVDRVIALLRARGVPAAFVNLGGNIAVLGERPDGRAWRVGIEHPREPKLMGYIELRSGAVATSGDYDRYFVMNGQRYNHIIDPRSGQPVQGVYALTVIAPTATAADALSTSAFVLGPKRGLALLNSCANTGGVMVEPGTDQALNVTYTPRTAANSFEIEFIESDSVVPVARGAADSHAKRTDC